MAEPDPNTTVTAPAPSIAPESSPIGGQSSPPQQVGQLPATGQQAQAPAPQTVTPPTKIVPVKQRPGEFFHSMFHALTGGALGVMAGPPPPTGYQTDTSGTMTPTPAPPDTTGSRLRRIAQAALIGLAAGSKIDPNDPAMKSGAGRALAGLGAGAEGERDYQQQQDLLKRSQATEQFKQQQQAKLDQAQNAHILLETMGLRQNLMQKDLETNQNVASLGADQVEAAIGGGNQIVGQRDMPEDQLSQFRNDHPEYLNYTPILSRVQPKVDAQGNPITDPKTGVQQLDRMYTMVDMKKPIQMTASMIDHLNKVGFPGADQLKAGQELDPKQFQAIYWQGIKAYNAAESDPKNKELTTTMDKDGNEVQMIVNKVTNSVTPLRDPETQKPLTGKTQTRVTDVFNPTTQKTDQWLIRDDNGKHIAYLGESPKDANLIGNSIGDYSKTGDAFLATIPPPMQSAVKQLTSYTIKPSDLGRSQNRLQLIEAAGQYDNTFDEKQYDQRQKFMEQWNGATGDGGNIRGINTAIGHLDLLSSAAQALQNNDINFFNKYANEFGYQTGTPARVAYDIIANKAAGEAARAVKTNATDKDVEDARAGFDSSQGPQQQRTAIIHQLKLLATQNDTLDTKFTQTMGKSPQAMGKPVIFPQNRAVMQKYGVPVEVEAPQPGQPATSANPQSGQPQTQQTAPTPQSHSFDPAAWQKANPTGDVNAAIAAAKQQGYQVKQ
jgi:hypothetical protein